MFWSTNTCDTMSDTSDDERLNPRPADDSNQPEHVGHHNK